MARDYQLLPLLVVIGSVPVTEAVVGMQPGLQRRVPTTDIISHDNELRNPNYRYLFYTITQMNIYTVQEIGTSLPVQDSDEYNSASASAPSQTIDQLTKNSVPKTDIFDP